METETRLTPNMTPQESLKKMEHVMAATRQKLDRHHCKQLLWWGYLSLSVTFLVSLCILTGKGSIAPWFWFAIPLIGTPYSFLLERKSSSTATSLTDQASQRTWMLFGSLLGILPLILIVTGHNEWILRLEMLFLSTGIALTGLICHFRPFTRGGLISLVTAFFLFIDLPWPMEAGIIGIIFILTLIVPGHLLLHSNHHCHV